MRRNSGGKWEVWPTVIVISVVGLAGCGSGGGGGGGVSVVSPITRVGGVQGNGDSDLGYAMSGTGRYVAFSSVASNLLPAGTDTNGAYDIFVYDAELNTTTRESVGQGVPPLQANDNSAFPSISADGRYVAFESDATNLVGNEDTNGHTDIFVRDRKSLVTERVSRALTGLSTQSDGDSFKPSISADGRYVAFYSFATNLGVAEDLNGASDVFVFDRSTGVAERVSVAQGGFPAQPDGDSRIFGQAISDDGRTVAFESSATNLVAGDTNGVKDVFVYSRATGTAVTIRVSVNSSGDQADGESRVVSMTGDGRYVVFESDATNLVAGDNNGVTDIFVRDLTAGTTTRVSIAATGEQANGASYALGASAISDDGRYVVFESDATNLVADDTNGVRDVFVRDIARNTTSRLSITYDSAQPTTISTEGAISRDGTVAAFGSSGTEYMPDNPHGFYDIYLRGVP